MYGLGVSSLIPKFIFVVVISILYFINFLFSETTSLWVVPLVGLFSGFFPFSVIMYGIFVSLYRFKVYKTKINFEQLPAGLNGLRIVQISDLHLGSFNYQYHLFDKAVEMINDLEADYIFFTGDLVNYFSWELEGWKSSLEKLTARYGKYSILGNHDYGDHSTWESAENKEKNFREIKDFHQQIGFHLLLNSSVTKNHQDDQMAIIGVENWGLPPFEQYGDLKKAMDPVKDIPFKILLSHDPSHWTAEVIHQTDIALTLSGHTHGMQAGIQVKDFAWSPIKYQYKQWAGLYQNESQYLYVNRGLGWLGFPARIGMRPEITLITLGSE